MLSRDTVQSPSQNSPGKENSIGFDSRPKLVYFAFLLAGLTSYKA
jgi:hypothetical protein